MDFIENIRVGEKRTKTGFRAEIDGPAAVLSAREISGIGVAEDPPTEGDEAFMFLCLCRIL
jgi:hypothetical protein